MGSGLVAVDRAGAVVALSEGAGRVLTPGNDAEAALGRPCAEVLAAQPTLARLLLEATAGREIPSRAELLLESASEVPRRIGFSVVPVRDDCGRLRGAALLFRDLTPYERMDEQERLRERLAALGEMAAGMAHEIRNPLAGMEVLAGLLRRRLAEGSEDRQLVDDLLGELRSVAGTLSDSLDFVKPVAPCRRTIDAVQLLEDCLAVARSRVRFEGTVERAYGGELPPLLADATQLRTLLTDLMVNALEAMAGLPPEAAQLRLAMRPEPRCQPLLRVGPAPPAAEIVEGASATRELVIAIVDSGPGVPPELSDRIFHPFVTTKERGSGIGLANAQKVVSSHGGSLELERGRAVGACFRVRLPLEERA